MYRKDRLLALARAGTECVFPPLFGRQLGVHNFEWVNFSQGYRMAYRTLHTGRWLFLTAFTVLVLNIPLIFYGFPLSEGWWETFGYLINHGLRPYRDFNLPISPVFGYLNAGLLKVVGDNFLTLRFVGAAEVSVTAAICFLFARRITRDSAAAFSAAMLAAILALSGPVYIAKDYHSFVDLLVAVDLLVLSNYLGWRGASLYGRAMLGALGLLSGLLIFVKINIGLFLCATIGLSVVITSHSRRRVWVDSGVYLGALLLTIAFSLALGSTLSGLPMLTLVRVMLDGDHSKGSAVTVLARFMLDPNNRQILKDSVATPLLLAFLVYVVPKIACVLVPRREKIRPSLYAFKAFSIVSVVVPPLLLLIAIYNLSRVGSANEGVLTLIPIVSLSVLFIATGRELSRYIRFGVFRPLGLLSLSVLVLAYCNTQTASFDNNGLFFVNLYAFSILGGIVSRAMSRTSIGLRGSSLIIAAVISLIPGVWYWKYLRPYDWWGLSVGSVAASRFNLGQADGGNAALDGVYTDKSTFKSYETILQLIRAVPVSDSANVYLFPDIPIFYMLAHKLPPTHNVVQWFDVATSGQLRQDLKYVKSGKASLIISLTPPDFAFVGNGDLVHEKLLQRSIVAAFPEIVSSGSYRVCYANILALRPKDTVTVHMEYDGATPISVRALVEATRAQMVDDGNGPVAGGIAKMDVTDKIKTGAHITISMPNNLSRVVRLGFVPLGSPDHSIVLALCRTHESSPAR